MAGLGQPQPTWGIVTTSCHLPSVWVLTAPHPHQPPQAQLVASQLQAELEKLRCTSALGSSEVEEAAQLKVLGAITSCSLLSLEAPWAQSTLV